MGTARTTYPRLVGRRGSARTWWGKAWQRAVEEAAYGEGDLRTGRRIARAGHVGGISVAPGSLLAAVREGDESWTVDLIIPKFDETEVSALVDVVAAETGRIAALLTGELPHELVEHADQTGVELLPYGGELGATCTCIGFLDPCPHALAVLVQAGWLIDDDPLVLFALRGLDRESLLADLHARSSRGGGRTSAGGAVSDLADDVEIAADAVLRARDLLELFDGEEFEETGWGSLG